MKRKIIVWFMSVLLVLSLAGCTEADKVSVNLSTQADNFNVLR